MGIIGDEFGYRQCYSDTNIFDDVTMMDKNYAIIQTCAEYELIPSTGSFYPGMDASLEFAVETSVKAIGMNRLILAGVLAEGDDLYEFYNNNIAALDTSSKSTSIDLVTAYAIVENAIAYSDSLVLPEICEITVNDGVIEVDSGICLYDDYTGEVTDGTVYNPGDILYVTIEGTLPRGIEIIDVSGAAFTYADASLEEVLADLYIAGTFSPTVVNVVSASEDDSIVYATDFAEHPMGEGKFAGLECYKDELTLSKGEGSEENSEDEEDIVEVSSSITIDENGVATSTTAKCDNVTATLNSRHTANSVHFDASLTGTPDGGDGATRVAAGSFSVDVENIQLEAVYNPGGPLELDIFHPKDFSARLSFDARIVSNLSYSVSQTITLGEVDVIIPNVPITITFTLKAHLAADGTITLTYTSNNVASVVYKKGCDVQPNFRSNSDLQLEADLTLTAEAIAGMHLKLGWHKASIEICNFSVTTGAVAVVQFDLDLLGSEPNCADLQIYVPLRFGLNQDSCLLTNISKKLKYEMTIWDSTNSAIKLHKHEEDIHDGTGFHEVPECTRGSASEATPIPEGEEQPIDEYDLFDFKQIAFETIKVAQSMYFISAGEIIVPEIIELPSDLVLTDIIFISEDTGVCVTAGQTITGIGPGSTTVLIQDREGRYQARVAITIYENYDIDFESLVGTVDGPFGGGASGGGFR